MPDNKSVKLEDLKDVTGGTAEKLALLKQDVLADVPAEVREKLAGLKSDVEVCKALVQNGVDVSALEKKLKASGFDLQKIGRKLTDNELEGAAGGFEADGYDYDVVCTCGNNNRDDFSYQYFASLVDSLDWYRCEKCNSYVAIAGHNILHYFSEEEYDNIYWKLF